MTEAASEYLLKPILTLEQSEGLTRGDTLWEDHETRIYYPENPLVPKAEGIHVRVESAGVPLHPKTREEWQGWLRHWAKTFGTGKVISEGRALPDMWQSFVGQSEYSPDGHLVTEVIGRNPSGESWGKTAPFPTPGYDHTGQRLEAGAIQELQGTMGRFFRAHWIPELTKVALFSEEPNVYPPGSERFKEVSKRNMNLPWPWESEPMMVSDVCDIVAILEPHLKTGIHLYIGLANAPIRPWRDLVRSLQGLAVAEATSQILEEQKLNGDPLAAWTSIRATGSWFGGFQTLKDDPSFQDPEMPRKWLKRRFRGAHTSAGAPEDWTMHFHPHVYGARYPDELIRLTQRPRNEGGDDWEGVTAMPVEKRHAIRDALNAHLFDRLRQTRGFIQQATT